MKPLSKAVRKMAEGNTKTSRLILKFNCLIVYKSQIFGTNKKILNYLGLWYIAEEQKSLILIL